MNSSAAILFSALSLFAFSAGAATNASKAVTESFQLIHVTELKALLGKPTTAIFDANSDETRRTTGMVPGAHALSSHAQYDVKKELPADKGSTLVFYCANTECMASHAAAKRAVEAGYTNVSVFADGIQGWVKAGEKTTRLQ